MALLSDNKTRKTGKWRKKLAASLLSFAGILSYGNLIQNNQDNQDFSNDNSNISGQSLTYEFAKSANLIADKYKFLASESTIQALSAYQNLQNFEFVDNSNKDESKQNSLTYKFVQDDIFTDASFTIDTDEFIAKYDQTESYEFVDNSNDKQDQEEVSVTKITPELELFSSIVGGDDLSAEKIRELQTAINDISENPIAVDGSIGPQTLNSAIDIITQNADIDIPVSDQFIHQLARFGLADDFGAKLAENPTALKRFIKDKTAGIDKTGQSYEYSTVIIQYALADYNPGPIDGGYGPLTQTAVNAFLDSYTEEQVTKIQTEQTKTKDNSATESYEPESNTDDSESIQNDTENNDNSPSYEQLEDIDDIIPTLNIFEELTAKTELNTDDIKTIQESIGSSPDGIFGSMTAKSLRKYLQENPAGYLRIGQGLDTLLQKTGTAPAIAADLAKIFKEDPEKVKDLGNEIISQNLGTYVYNLAVTVASGQTDTSKVKKSINEKDVQKHFQQVLFASKGITDTQSYRTEDGEYRIDELGLCLANFKPSDSISVRKCQEALNENGYEAGTVDGVAGRKTALAMATAISDNPVIADIISESKILGNRIFSYLLTQSKRNPEIAETLRNSEGFNAVMIRDIVLYAAQIDTAIHNATHDGKISITSPDNNSLGLRLALLVKSYDQPAKPIGFNADFSLVASSYLQDFANNSDFASYSLLHRFTQTYEQASLLEPSFADPKLVEKLKKRYPHARGDIIEIVTEICNKHGVNPEAVLALMDIESRLNPTIRPLDKNGNPRTSAVGLTQAITDTWRKWWNKFSYLIAGTEEKAKKYGILELRKDPAIATELLVLEIKSGKYKDIMDYYAIHHFGDDTVLRVPASTPASAIFDSKVLVANPYLYRATAGSIRSGFRAKFARRGAFDNPLYTDARYSETTQFTITDDFKEYRIAGKQNDVLISQFTLAENEPEVTSQYVFGSNTLTQIFLAKVFASIAVKQEYQNEKRERRLAQAQTVLPQPK